MLSDIINLLFTLLVYTHSNRATRLCSLFYVNNSYYTGGAAETNAAKKNKIFAVEYSMLLEVLFNVQAIRFNVLALSKYEVQRHTALNIKITTV
jgi:hypothetical protein